MTEKVFYLGLGHQKCGTSWLFRYLDQYPRFNGGFTKEYHVWDIVDIEEFKGKIAPSNPLKRLAGIPRELRRRSMIASGDRYFNYFNCLYKNGVTMTADITPSYSALSEARLSQIKAEFDIRGVAVKPIVLIRDPVDRIISAVRYNLSRGNYGEGISSGNNDFDSALAEYYTSAQCKLRTSYDATIKRALAVFGAENVYVGVFESMFTQPEIERLSQFLAVPVNSDFAQVNVNKSKSKSPHQTPIETDIRTAYANVYEYCFEFVPETKLLWRQASV